MLCCIWVVVVLRCATMHPIPGFGAPTPTVQLQFENDSALWCSPTRAILKNPNIQIFFVRMILIRDISLGEGGSSRLGVARDKWGDAIAVA